MCTKSRTLEYIGVYDRIILKRYLEKYGVRVCTEFNRLRTDSSKHCNELSSSIKDLILSVLLCFSVRILTLCQLPDVSSNFHKANSGTVTLNRP